MNKKPLVSIMIPNYNYGHYLRNCLDSVLNQTYENIDVYFRDNNSTDDSFQIAMEYVAKFKERDIPFMIANNKRNVGSDKNTDLLLNSAEGKYGYVLASDDYIAPDFIEKCVSVFENHPNTALVMTHRNEVDEFGNVTKTPPFYNKSCLMSGESQAAVFMMAGIAVPCQRMYNGALTIQARNFKKNWLVAGDWFNNFLCACCGDVAYIKEPLCYYRVHTGNETSVSEDLLTGSFEHFMLINTFATIAEAFRLKKPVERYDAAVKKLGSMCFRYALKMYQNQKKDIARKYLRLSLVYDEELEKTEQYKLLAELQNCTGEEFAEKLKKYEQTFAAQRTVSYDPPEGWKPLEF